MWESKFQAIFLKCIIEYPLSLIIFESNRRIDKTTMSDIFSDALSMQNVRILGNPRS